MRTLLASFLMVLLAVPAFAAFQGPTTEAPTGTVKEVLGAMRDDTKICMEGNIVSKVVTSKTKYNFQDQTGAMVVEIKEIVFGGQNVTPSTKVRICGEVDKEYMKDNEFEAKFLQVVGQ